MGGLIQWESDYTLEGREKREGKIWGEEEENERK